MPLQSLPVLRQNADNISDDTRKPIFEVYTVVIGRTVGPVSSVGRAPDLQAGGRGFESCIGHTFSSLVYYNGDEVNW